MKQKKICGVGAFPREAPDKPTYIDITFENGDAVALDGMRMKPGAIISYFNSGWRTRGRLDLVENRYVGMKSRGCYETPGGTILLPAHGRLNR